MANLILLIEDEADLARSLSYSLQREGFQTRVAHSGAAGLALATGEPQPALVLLDLMLPDASGTEICRQLRADDRTKAIPVIMVTARDDEIDRVVGFEVGADDYVTKPFSTRELVLRIRAVLKRMTIPAPTRESLEVGAVRIDVEAHQAWLHGEPLDLTALEFKLLQTLVARRGRVQTRDGLLNDVWGYSGNVTTRTVDTHIKRLRAKLGDGADAIETLRGVGYRFRAES